VSDFHIFWSVLVRDPDLFLGLLSVGLPIVGYWRIYRKLKEVGFKYPSRFTIPAVWWEAYVREYAQREPIMGGQRGHCM
jgi:hypothetical protein